MALFIVRELIFRDGSEGAIMRGAIMGTRRVRAFKGAAVSVWDVPRRAKAANA